MRLFFYISTLIPMFLQAHDLVPLRSVTAAIYVDMRYTSRDNCFLVAEVADKLDKVRQLLERQGYGLKIFDAYRPYRFSVSAGFADPYLKVYLESDLAASCGHSRGTSVDVALVCADGGKLDMGSNFGSASPASHPDCRTLPANVYHNRCILRRAMERYGFIPSPENWWHYDYGSCSLYPLLDISFQDLINIHKM